MDEINENYVEVEVEEVDDINQEPDESEDDDPDDDEPISAKPVAKAQTKAKAKPQVKLVKPKLKLVKRSKVTKPAKSAAKIENPKGSAAWKGKPKSAAKSTKRKPVTAVKVASPKKAVAEDEPEKASKVTKAIKQAAVGAVKIVKRSKKPTTLHVREKPAKDADTLCGGSHSPIWNIKGKRPLESVGPQQANKATCGRCRRVAVARELI